MCSIDLILGLRLEKWQLPGHIVLVAEVRSYQRTNPLKAQPQNGDVISFALIPWVQAAHVAKPSETEKYASMLVTGGMGVGWGKGSEYMQNKTKRPHWDNG